MKITWGLENASHVSGTIATLGSYDGVHLGHQKILRQLTQRKQEFGMSRSAVLTFHPHPQQVLRRNNNPVELLTTIEERLDLLAAQGVDETIVIEFSLEFAQTSYIDFFRNVVVEQLGTERMVVGFNHAFGKNREGDAEHLKVLAPQLGVKIEEIAPLFVDGVPVSSSTIRSALKESKLKTATRYLGRPYSFSGQVVHGDALGRELGFPTANIAPDPSKAIPADGVYAARVRTEGHSFVSALSIGSKPTLAKVSERTIEALLLDFSGNLYDKTLSVECLEYIRPQERFASLEELKTWIAKDVEKIQTLDVG